MLELILFFVFLFVIHNLISFLSFKLGVKKIGCFSSIVILIFNVFLSITISSSLVKDESNKFFDFNKSNNNSTLENENTKNDFYSKKNSNNYKSLDNSNHFNSYKTQKNYYPTYNSNSKSDYTSEYDYDDYDYENSTEGKIRVGAICNDGTRSYSTGSGTCSHHGGVAYWIYE